MRLNPQSSRFFGRRIGIAALSFGISISCAVTVHSQSLPVSKALSGALKETQASAVVLNARSGDILAIFGPESRSTTGSVTKPFFLEYGLEHAVVRADTEVYCKRHLRVGQLLLPCTHPANLPVFTAESALAESCNTWFAELGRRLSGPQLEEAMKDNQLHHASMASADTEQRQLAVLGVRGVDATPLELAKAYYALLQRISGDGPVARGLAGSVAYGMANQAAVPGMTILGKTGTASNTGEAWTHGWFAGVLPGRLVIVVYVPHGDGGTAASLAQKFFKAMDGQAR